MAVSVSKYELIELKSMVEPPIDIKKTLISACLLLGCVNADEARNPHDSRIWNIVQRVLSKNSGPNSMQSLMSAFDPKTVGSEEFQKAKELVEGMSAERIANVSKAAKTLLQWVTGAIAAVEQNPVQVAA